MATRYAVATGTWDAANTAIWSAASGGAPGASVPTSADDVVFDAASGAITVTTSGTPSVCKNLTCTGFTGTLTSGGSANAPTINGNVTLSTGGTYSTLSLSLTPGAGVTATVTSVGKTLAVINVNGSATGTVVLADALTSNATLQLTIGTLDTANFAVTCGVFSSNNSNTRTLNLGSSSITLTGSAGTNVWVITTSTGMTLNPGTSTITATGANANFGGSPALNNVVMSGAGPVVIAGAVTCVNFTKTGVAAKTDELRLSASLTCTGTFTVTSNSSVNRMLVSSSVVGTARTITAATVVVSNVVDFSDITGAGAATWTVAGTGASALGDAGGNSGITFTAAATQTRSGVGGNWSTAASWTSRVPLPQDNVIIDSGSSGTITADMPRLGADITCTGFAGTLTQSTGCTNYGSVTLAAGMTFTAGGNSFVFAGRGTHTLTSAGKSFAAVTFRGGAYSLLDALASSSSIGLSTGSLNTGSFAVTCTTFTGTTGTSLTLGTSTVTLTTTAASAAWTVTSGMTLSLASSTIVISGASANQRQINGANATYGTITYTVAASTGALYIVGGNTIGVLNVSGGTRSLIFQAATTNTVTTWNVYGLVGAVVTVKSDTGASAATISKSSGYIASDYVSVQDITGTGGATFYMGSRSTSVSGNTGLTFTDAPQRYWVGGTATWDATVGTKWAVVSGGTGGLAVPTTADDVYLDGNSGAVTVTASSGTCKALICTGFTGTLTGTVTAAGSVTLVAGMTVTALSFTLSPATSTTMILTTAGKVLSTVGVGSGAQGVVSLGDALSCSLLQVNSGGFTTNNFAVTSGSFASSNSNTRTLTLGSSSVTITGTGTAWNTATSTGLTLSAAAATIVFTSTLGLNMDNGAAHTFGAVTYNGGASFGLLRTAVTIGNLTYTGTAVKTGLLSLGVNVTVTGTFTVSANSATNRVLVQSNVTGSARMITAAAVVVTNVVDFTDITGAGAATWTVAATGATALGDALGNSGITFTAAVTRYAVVAGNWSSTATWSTVSGGAGGASVPLPQDTVILDASSAAGTYTLDMPRSGGDLVCTGFTRTLSFASIATSFYGSITLASGMTVSGTLGLTLSGRGTHTITSAGKSFGGNVTLLGPGGTYTMQDALTTPGPTGLIVTAGTLVTGSFAVTTPTFTSTGSLTRGFTGGTSTVTLTVTSGTVWNTSTGLTLSAASVTIVISAASASSRTFTAAAGGSYGALTYTVAASTGALIVTNGNTFGTINVASGRTLTLPSSTTTTVTTWNVIGTAGNLVTVNSSTAGTAATLSKTTGSVISGYLSIQDITATGGATWYAGATSTDVSGNTGWIFTDMPIGSQIDLRWAVRAAVGSQRDVRWAVRSTSASSRDLRWAVRSTSGSQRDVRWSVRTTVGRSRDLRWSVLLTAGSQRQIEWSLTAPVASARDLRWTVRAPVGTQADVRWTVTLLIGTSRELRWSLTAPVGSDATLLWPITAGVGSQAALRWTVAARVGSARDVRWAARQTVGSSRDVRWPVGTAVASQRDLRWAARAQAGTSRTVRWPIATLAGGERVLRWRTYRSSVGAVRGGRLEPIAPVRGGTVSPVGVSRVGRLSGRRT